VTRNTSSRKKKPPPAVFLDRDGVINADRRDYVKSWSEFKFLPTTFDSLKLFAEKGICVVVVTNQSAVNRGLMSLRTLKAIHRKMLAEIRRRGGDVQAIYFCPHTPAENCDCRKPKPGMVLRAVEELEIDLASSYFVGDSDRDVELARTLGIKCIRISEKVPHQRTSRRGPWSPRRPIAARTLGDAAGYILDDIESSSSS
jgi:histidinol-phosphate phosphatase family protein